MSAYLQGELGPDTDTIQEGGQQVLQVIDYVLAQEKISLQTKRDLLRQLRESKGGYIPFIAVQLAF